MVRRRVGFGSAVLHQEDHHMHIASIGIDLGKTTFHLVALGEHNKILLRKKFSRTQLLAYTANLPASYIGLEAGAGAHFMGAALREQGHQVRLIPAQFVKPYRKSNKNDFIDAAWVGVVPRQFSTGASRNSTASASAATCICAAC
jgi:hypothetical protein